MRTFEDRVKQFYREFPDLRPFVKFRSKEQSAHIVHIAEDANETWFREHLLSDTEKQGFHDCVEFNMRYVRTGPHDEDIVIGETALISLDEDSGMIKHLQDTFNLTTANISKIQCKELDNDFSNYHETGHALSRLDKNSVRYKQKKDTQEGWLSSDVTKSEKDTLREECFVDSYATLRMIQDHGAKGISFMKCIADIRMLVYTDSVHLTTFSIDRSIKQAVELMKTGELKNKTPQELYDIAQKIADQDEFLLERRKDRLNLPLTKYDPEVGEEKIDRESWAYKGLRELELFEKNDTEQTIFSSAVKGRFNRAVHKTLDLTNHEKFSFSEEETYNGPWSDANAKYLHAREGDKVLGTPYSEEDLGNKENEVRLYSKCLLRGLRKGMDDDAVAMNYNKIKKIDDFAFLHVMKGLTKKNGESQRRSRALEMLLNPRKFARMYLDSGMVSRKNRLAKMNERKNSSIKPKTM